MPTDSPSSADYVRQLARDIRDYHRLLLPAPGTHARRSTPDPFRITQVHLAAFAQIDTGEFSRYLNGRSRWPITALQQISSMPWVTPEAATRWSLVWVAAEMTQPVKEAREDGSAFVDAMTPPGWEARRALARTGAALARLASYGATLGVIDQIDHARRRARDVVTTPGHQTPPQGPRVYGDDFEQEEGVPMRRVLQDYKRRQPLTALTLQFASDFARIEAELHAAEVNHPALKGEAWGGNSTASG